MAQWIKASLMTRDTLPEPMHMVENQLLPSCPQTSMCIPIEDPGPIHSIYMQLITAQVI